LTRLIATLIPEMARHVKRKIWFICCSQDWCRHHDTTAVQS